MEVNSTNYRIYALCLLWAGVLIGVSFIATPAKFLVAELDIVTAIKIGRVTFKVYHYFELAMICITTIALLIYRVEKTVWLYFSLLGLVLAAQYLLLLPRIEASSDMLFSGLENPKKSNAHLYYIFCDCLKAILLLAFLPFASIINSKITKKQLQETNTSP